MENLNAQYKEISPKGGHYFFGYYDLQPYDATGRYHLCHKVSFIDRIPEADDVAELGYIDLKTGKFCKVAETTAWNFQQGALLQWYGSDSILYNIRVGDHFETAITNIYTGVTRTCPRPSANVSADGKYSLSINFSRIFDFRPGYGYAGVPDPFKENAPADDGVWLQDLHTGESELVVSYDRIAKEFPQKPYCDHKLVVNHITFNPSGNRFLILLREFPEPRQRRKTLLLTSDLEGNLYKLNDFNIDSHYHWKNDREIIMLYGSETEQEGLYYMEDLTQKRVHIPEKAFYDDIHCLYSPDRRFFTGDGYPFNEERKRTIWMYEVATDKCVELNRVLTTDPENTDLRCDLHVRWDRTGKKLSFDSNDTGRRTICEMDMTQIIENWK